MPTEELIHYAIYGTILLATVIILKWPKDKKDEDKKQKEDN
jgi:preprotein translocase subunit SecF